MIEKVIIQDAAVFNAVEIAKGFATPDAVFAGPERDLSADLKWLGELGGLPLSNLTLYALRRGGATHDIQQHFSMGRTMELGASLTNRSLRILDAGRRVAAMLVNQVPSQAIKTLESKVHMRTSIPNKNDGA